MQRRYRNFSTQRKKKTTFQVFGQGLSVRDMISVASLVIFQLLILCATTTKLPLSSRGSEGEWEDCSYSLGMCFNVNSHTCSGKIVKNVCPGPWNIRCCVTPSGISYGSCETDHCGLCKRRRDCRGTTVAGLCPGPEGIVCCPGHCHTGIML